MKKKYLWSILCSFSFCLLALLTFICIIALATAQGDQVDESANAASSSGCSPLPINYALRNYTADFDTFVAKDELSQCIGRTDKDSGLSGCNNTKAQEAQKWSQEKKLKVFLVPHSHNDAGWLKTFEVYYKTITKNILDNMLEHMSNDTEMRFTWAEIAFFDLWWKELDSNKRFLVKKLVANKQLEFIGGGWVMPDEASTHYVSYLTQMIEGHQWLKQEFNYTPTRGWTIDPFGLSPTYALLQKRASMESCVITRIHYAMKKYLSKHQNFEFNWRQSWDPKGDTDMFTHVMPSQTYDTADTCGPNHDVCDRFSKEVGGEVIVPLNDTAKIRERALSVVEQFRLKSKDFRTPNILVPIGGDFKWNTPESWNQGLAYMRSIVEFINSRDDLNTELRITTLDDYFSAVAEDMRESTIAPKSLVGDFFTYADRKNDYWSGYFTSRIYHKVTERQLLAKLRSAQISFSLMTAEVFKKRGTLSFDFISALLEQLIESRRTLSLFQHHDGITGTSKDHVVVDYAQKMDAALKKSNFVTQQSLFVLSHIKSLEQNQLERVTKNDVFLEPKAYKQNFTDLWTDRLINLDAGNPGKTITIFNSLAQTRMELIHLNVSSPNVKVYDANDVEMPSEVLPMIKYVKPNSTNPPGVEIRSNEFDLVFQAEFQPFEVRSFQIKYSSSYRPKEPVVLRVLNCEAIADAKLQKFFQISSGENSTEKQFTISNPNFKLQFNENGTLSSAIQNESEIAMSLTFLSYSTVRSGVYLFIPNGEAVPIETISPVIVVVEGKLESYVRSYYDTVFQQIRLENQEGIGSNAIQVELLVDVREKVNYELIMRLDTSIQSEDVFHTDSNGFQMMRRKYLNDLPIQGNYYPVASSAYIEDPHLRMTLLAAQPGGASSLAPGQLEIMLDRIVNQDDYRGVGQNGTDNLQVVSKFTILIETPSCEPISSAKNARLQEKLSLGAHHQLHSLLYPLATFMQPEDQNVGIESSGGLTNYLIQDTHPLPCDIHLAGTFPFPKHDDEESLVPEARNEAALLFHRLGFDPRFDNSQLAKTCDLGNRKAGRVKVQDVLGGLISSRMERMSLNFNNEEEVTYSGEEFLMTPMEVYAFRAHFITDQLDF